MMLKGIRPMYWTELIEGFNLVHNTYSPRKVSSECRLKPAARDKKLPLRRESWVAYGHRLLKDCQDCLTETSIYAAMTSLRASASLRAPASLENESKHVTT